MLPTLNGEARKHGTWPTSRFPLHQTSVNILYRIKAVQQLSTSENTKVTILPQLSKCPKFEAVQGVKLIKWFEFEQREIKRPMRVLLFTEWRIIII